MTKKKENSMFSTLKSEAPVIREALGQLPPYKRLLFPLVIIAGAIYELVREVKLNGAEKKLIEAINEKYDIEEVKLHARGCSTDPRNVYQSQMSVMQVNGNDYSFVLVIDSETGEPTLYPAPYIDDSMPYQPCPIDPIDLLKKSGS
jgi:hypothetical protein